jgi:group I intron endonuclease
MTCGIYQIQNRLDGRRYIGQSVNIERRWEKHKKGNTNPHLCAAIKKYGLGNFECIILCSCSPQDLDLFEQRFLDKLINYSFDYNLAKDAMSPNRGRKASEETKKKKSLAMMGNKHLLGYVFSEESKQKLSLASKGRKDTEETKKRRQEAQLGRTHTAETRAKLSDNQKGKRHSEETKKKMSLSRMGNTNTLGYKHSEETKKKMSVSAKKHRETIKGKKRPFEIGAKIKAVLLAKKQAKAEMLRERERV